MWGVHKIILGVISAIFLVGAAQPANASVSYLFQVDTSTISGTQGFIEFQFTAAAGSGPGATNPTAMAQVSSFALPGGSVSATPTDVLGHVTGVLPGTVTLDVQGDGQPNDYFHGVQFGSTLSFILTLSGQAIDGPYCPGGGGTTCSLPGFALDLVNSTGDGFLLTNDPSGMTADGWILGLVQINQDGSTTPTKAAGPGGGASKLTITALSNVPEPGSWSLMITAFAIVALFRRRRTLAA